MTYENILVEQRGAVGIITLDDLLRQLAIPLAELAALSLRERAFEARTRA